MTEHIQAGPEEFDSILEWHNSLVGYRRHVEAAEELIAARACYDMATVHALLAIAAAIKQQATK